MWKRAFFVFSIFAAGALYAWFIMKTGWGIPCLLYVLTGYECPGCGMSRMFIFLIKLDFYAAFRMNPLMFILLPFFAVFMSFAFAAYILDKPNKLQSAIPRGVYFAILAVVIVFGVLRNIPAFSFLSATAV